MDALFLLKNKKPFAMLVRVDKWKKFMEFQPIY